MKNHHFIEKKIFHISRKFIYLILIFLVASLTITIGFVTSYSEFNQGDIFSRKSLHLEGYDAFDLGIVDVNDDGNLDIFTANHSALQNILINDGKSSGINQIESLQLSQDRSFSGLEITDKGPVRDSPGIYIYRRKKLQFSIEEPDNELIVEAFGINRTGSLNGQLVLDSSVKISDRKGISVDVDQYEVPSGGTESVIKFSAGKDGRLVIQSKLTALPVFVEMGANVSPSLVHVGVKKHSPKTGQFALHWRDRHGMAWADYSGDGLMDLFIARGGLKGRIFTFPHLFNEDFFNDELFINTSNGFDDKGLMSGVLKKDCPGRQAAWTDIDGDNKLDLYVVCGRWVPPNEIPNQLYRQDDNQKFSEVASKVGLDNLEHGSFAWLDIENDGDDDFFWATKESFQIYLNEKGYFTRDSVIEHPNGKIKKLTIADFDSDGDLDIFAAQPATSRLLVNQGGSFTTILPDSIGLPTAVKTANWVDFDNDGLIDLHAIPDGLYRQLPNHSFETTKLLEHQAPFSKLLDARCSWFDFDNDGNRDAVMLVRYRPFWMRILGSVLPNIDPPDPRQWTTFLYSNLGNQNHWLQVQLNGSDGNRQAIGSVVEIKSQGKTQYQQVGQSEGSHYSQGHYRLYFGLGDSSQVDSIKVTWPNGDIQDMKNVETDQILIIDQLIET